MCEESWNIEKDLCRCCHAQGSFDNLAVPQPYLEDVEIYTDMLKDCLNIEISPVPGDLCIMTYKICKTCIKKLRNANNFRKQVKSCEERFLDMFYKNRVRALNSTLNVVVKKEEQENIALPIDLKEEDSPSPADDDDYHIKHDFDDEDDKDQDSSDDDISLSKCKSEKSKRRRKCKEESKSKKERIKKEKTQRTDSMYDEFYTLKENTEDSSHLYSCNTCLKSYKKIDGFKQHYRHVHLKQRPKLIGCYYCAEKVPHHKRASHLEDVHGVPAPSCGACGKKFNFPFQVLRHHKTYHMGERKFVCGVCDRLFASNAYLSAHMVKHSSERPFKCDVCDDTFKWKKHLKRHVLLHLSRKN